MKIKLHLLKHLPDHIRQFGPAVQFATEVFECFNKIFQASSVLSNHQAPSRDIARKNVDLDCVKHLLSGGYWPDTQSKVWSHAGAGISETLRSSPALQRHLGWTAPVTFTPGSVRCHGKQKHEALVTAALQTKAMQAGAQLPAESAWYPAIEATAHTGDTCPVGSWVVVRLENVSDFVK